MVYLPIDLAVLSLSQIYIHSEESSYWLQSCGYSDINENSLSTASIVVCSGVSIAEVAMKLVVGGIYEGGTILRGVYEFVWG